MELLEGHHPVEGTIGDLSREHVVGQEEGLESAQPVDRGDGTSEAVVHEAERAE